MRRSCSHHFQSLVSLIICKSRWLNSLGFPTNVNIFIAIVNLSILLKLNYIMINNNLFKIKLFVSSYLNIQPIPYRKPIFKSNLCATTIKTYSYLVKVSFEVYAIINVQLKLPIKLYCVQVHYLFD